jgi:hypothetical protein
MYKNEQDSLELGKVLAAYQWTLYVVVSGDPFDDGMRINGPYGTHEEACEAASALRRRSLEVTFIVPLRARDLTEWDA